MNLRGIAGFCFVTLLVTVCVAEESPQDRAKKLVFQVPVPESQMVVETLATTGDWPEWETRGRDKKSGEIRKLALGEMPVCGQPMVSKDGSVLVVTTGGLSAGTAPTVFRRDQSGWFGKGEQADQNGAWGAALAAKRFPGDAEASHLYLTVCSIDTNKASLNISVRGNAAFARTEHGFHKGQQWFKDFGVAYNYADKTWQVLPKLPKIPREASSHVRTASEAIGATPPPPTKTVYEVGCTVRQCWIAHCGPEFTADYGCFVEFLNFGDAALRLQNQYKDPKHGLVFLFSRSCPTDYAQLGSSSTVSVGDELTTGRYFGHLLYNHVYRALTGAVVKKPKGVSDDADYFFATFPSSARRGGPVITHDGNLVGVITSTTQPKKSGQIIARILRIEAIDKWLSENGIVNNPTVGSEPKPPMASSDPKEVARQVTAEIQIRVPLSKKPESGSKKK